MEALRNILDRIRGVTRDSQIAGDYGKALKLWEKAYAEAREAVKKAPAGGQEDGRAKNSLSELKKVLEKETNYSYEHVNWLSDMAVITQQQKAIFYEAVAKISKRGYYCPINADGLYIVDLGDVLVFTDADYNNPKIYRAVQFADKYESNIQEYKERIIDEEGHTAGFRESLRIIETVEGEGFLTEYTSPYGSTYEGKNRTGKGRNLKGSDSKSEIGRNSSGVKKNSVAGAEKILEEVMQRRLKEAAEKYGTIPPGENPVRKVSVPMQTSEGKRASFTIRTVLEAGITPDELVPKLTEEILNGTFSDDVHTNKETIKKGEDWMAQFTKVEKAVDVFTEEVRSGENISEETTMRGYILYNQLADAAAKELLKLTGHRFIPISLN